MLLPDSGHPSDEFGADFDTGVDVDSAFEDKVEEERSEMGGYGKEELEDID